ncbi:hypothetical protein [Flavobacterium collinsii]|uniref:Uncharacterized protein n=1 Tax=Flavobacterium collinsii TaxID=1114861 RepID=A0A9W4TKB8_9FLAO|nr:hypothetical protein [Flavobacterium collinsii]CAI2768626.1 conserved protein of unknown function [Flavobacterium collinsii]
MNQTYLLEWLDSVVTLNLNPKKSAISNLTPVESKAIIDKAVEETQFIQTQFTIRVFSLSKEKHIKVLVKNYHSALISLWDQLIVINKSIATERKDLQEVTTALLTALDELLNFLESRFACFISLDSKIPVSYLSISYKKIKLRIDKLRTILHFNPDEKMLAEIVFNTLYCFANAKENKKVTFREILYYKELLKELESLKTNKTEDLIHTDLMQVLIYMNFNSKLFINFYTQAIAMKISKFEQGSDRIGWLLLYAKELNQIAANATAALNCDHQNLKKVLLDWFKQEINFLEKKENLKTAASIPSENKKLSQQNPVSREEKILCQLSTDQTALILRACQELEILVSKSMNQVFKTIVPFLSTPFKKNLSFDSMRSKAYVAEERDKEIAVETLQRIIKQIREY